MTKEFVKHLSSEQLQQAHISYTRLALIFEDVCGGPYKAREFKEYFAIMDSRENIRQEYNNRAVNQYGTTGGETPNSGADQ